VPLKFTKIFETGTYLFFIVAPRILIYVEFTHQKMHFYLKKKH